MSRKNNGTINSKYVRILNGALFCAFSFLFLYFIQGELLAEAQYVYSKGVTTYAILPGAIIITFFLLLIQWLTVSLLKFNDDYYALSYFPSCLLLAIITSLDEIVLLDFGLGNLTWMLPVVLLLYILFVIFLGKLKVKENYNAQKRTFPPICVNCIVLLTMFLLIGSYANNKDIFTYELKIERLILEGNYSEASKVGEKSLRSSRRMTELRMFALAKDRLLLDKMFEYPQYYGVDGLFDISEENSDLYRFSSVDICKAIGICSDDSLGANGLLETSFVKLGDSVGPVLNGVSVSPVEEVGADTLSCVNIQMLKDYYCAYLLLDKKIGKFCLLQDTAINNVLPKHFAEAIILAHEYKEHMFVHDDGVESDIHNRINKLYSFVDSTFIKKREDFIKIQNDIESEVEKMNALRRKYGDTYWWYYEYSDFVENPIY